MSIILKDFRPVNTWKPEENGEKWGNGNNKSKYLVDQTTGRRYWNESKGCVRSKCVLLALGTPFVHPFAVICNVVYRILKLISFSHFWMPKTGKYNFKARLAEAGKDLLRIAISPIALVGLELSSLYGIIRPYDARKLYASFERLTYNHFIMAPCFQPDPTRHALGGDPNRPDQI